MDIAKGMSVDKGTLPRYGEVLVDGQRYINRVPITIVPKQPKSSDIFGHGKAQKSQKWSRQELPKDFEKWGIEEKEAYWEREWDRRKNGFWFYNNGEATYITGAHYFYLNWCQIDVGYPDYRDRDRRFFYFWEECSRDIDAYGMIFMKHRREGASWKSAALQLYYTTSEFNAHGGMLSKSGVDAKKLFLKTVYIWRRLPSFFMPISDGTDNPKTEINFQRPAKRRGANHLDVDNGITLDSSVSWANTTENGFDGQKLRFFNSDECFAPDTKILTADGKFTPVSDINVGDYVVVDGGKKVRVAKRFEGVDDMFIVRQPYGKDYVVNSKHRLVLDLGGVEVLIAAKKVVLIDPYVQKFIKSVVNTDLGHGASGKVSVEPFGVGKYVGIQLEADNDNDRRLILEDGTVTMNCGKWVDVSAENNWYIVKPALATGRKIYGKALFTSTVNEMDKGGKAFKSLWVDSGFFDRDDNNQTVSGLYSYFTAAYDGYEGYIDEYGKSVIDDPKEPVMGIDGVLIKKGAKTFLQNRRKSLAGDTNKLAEEKRMFPFDEEEALRSPAKDCQFDAERIYQQLEWLDVWEDTYVERGNFVWRNGRRGNNVDFIPTKSGRWLVAWMPKKEDQNGRDTNGYPLNMGNIVMGCDPYDHRFVSDGRASKGAAYVFRMALPNEADSNMFVCQYLFRPPSPEMFYEDMLMTALFYGCQILVETQKIGLINFLDREGYGKFIMDRPDSTHTKWSKTNQKGKGIPSSPAIIDSITGTTEHYVLTNVGILGDEVVGNVYFRDLLNDWLKFDPSNTKDYDCAMSAGYALLATKKTVRTRKEQKAVNVVRRFNNSGTLSKILQQ